MILLAAPQMFGLFDWQTVIQSSYKHKNKATRQLQDPRTCFTVSLIDSLSSFSQISVTAANQKVVCSLAAANQSVSNGGIPSDDIILKRKRVKQAGAGHSLGAEFLKVGTFYVINVTVVNQNECVNNSVFWLSNSLQNTIL